MADYHVSQWLGQQQVECRRMSPDAGRRSQGLTIRMCNFPRPTWNISGDRTCVCRFDARAPLRIEVRAEFTTGAPHDSSAGTVGGVQEAGGRVHPDHEGEGHPTRWRYDW